MMLVLYIIAFWIILIFGFVIFFGAPYLPTLKAQKQAAFDLLKLEKGQTLIELGCGDGTMLLAAAEKGLRVIGYELNPLLAFISYVRTYKYRDNVKVIWGNYWTQVWPRADGIYVFLLDRYMKKLDKKIIQNYPEQQIKLASFTFKVPDREPVKTKKGVYLYLYDNTTTSKKEAD
jgi:hypothetical protein